MAIMNKSKLRFVVQRARRAEECDVVSSGGLIATFRYDVYRLNRVDAAPYCS